LIIILRQYCAGKALGYGARVLEIKAFYQLKSDARLDPRGKTAKREVNSVLRGKTKV